MDGTTRISKPLDLVLVDAVTKMLRQQLHSSPYGCRFGGEPTNNDNSKKQEQRLQCLPIFYEGRAETLGNKVRFGAKLPAKHAFEGADNSPHYGGDIPPATPFDT